MKGLELVRGDYIRVRKGQTLAAIAETYSLPPRLIAAENALTEEVTEGQILRLPHTECNLYTVRGGESKTLLCGSPETFERLNRTQRLYPGQKVFLSQK